MSTTVQKIGDSVEAMTMAVAGSGEVSLVITHKHEYGYVSSAVWFRNAEELFALISNLNTAAAAAFAEEF